LANKRLKPLIDFEHLKGRLGRSLAPAGGHLKFNQARPASDYTPASDAGDPPAPASTAPRLDCAATDRRHQPVKRRQKNKKKKKKTKKKKKWEADADGLN